MIELCVSALRHDISKQVTFLLLKENRERKKKDNLEVTIVWEARKGEGLAKYSLVAKMVVWKPGWLLNSWLPAEVPVIGGGWRWLNGCIVKWSVRYSVHSVKLFVSVVRSFWFGCTCKKDCIKVAKKKVCVFTFALSCGYNNFKNLNHGVVNHVLG